MSGQSGYYSLVQFFADPSRLEGVNIGVLVFSSADKKLQVRISRSNHRIKRFFGNQNWAFVNRAKTATVNQLRSQYFASVEDLAEYISKRANAIQLTAPRAMRVFDIQEDLDRLFDLLVGEDVTEKHRISGDLTKAFLDAGVKNLVRRAVKVDISNLNKPIRVPYAYQNGRFNLISPVQFESDTDAILRKTGKSAIEGQLLYNERHNEYGAMRLVVVANFDQEIEKATREVVKRIFDDHNVTLYSFENLNPLLEDIRQSAIDHS